MRFLTDADVGRLLTVEQAAEAITDAFVALDDGRASFQSRVRTGGAVGKLSTVGAVVDADGIAGAKVYTTAPDGTFRFSVVLFDPAEARWLAAMDGADLTRIRTAATSLVAARRLARPGSSVLAVFGAGVQARAHCLALAGAFPVEEIRVVHRRPAPDLVRSLRCATELEVRQVGDPPEAVEGADLIVTATRSTAPLFPGARVGPGSHVTSVGATTPDARELDDDLMGRADVVVVESREQARREAGNLIGAVAAGVAAWDRVLELSALVSGTVRGRTRPGEITLFDSLGIGLEDVAVAGVVLRRAMETGAGVEL